MKTTGSSIHRATTARLLGVLLLLYSSVISISPAATPQPAASPRTSIALDAGWRFKLGSTADAVQDPSYDDSNWSEVNLPHTWNRLGNAGTERSPLTNDVQGVGWYRLRFKASKSAASRYFLEFDAVSEVADIWLNGHYVGKHAGAFARFRFDISDLIARSGDNLLVVKADNTRPAPGASTENVIPLSGDFFVFGGIYRKVSLVICNPLHVDMMDYGGPGLYARALQLAPDAATVLVTARVTNEAPRTERVRVETAIDDAAGNRVATAEETVRVPGAQSVPLQTTLRVSRPRLWEGVTSPYLYSTTMTVRSAHGAVLDRVTQPLGLRTMSFDADKGFVLNGKPLFLQGVSLHQDRAGVGWAISREDQRQDFDLLMEMGANAVRLAHYQHDQYSYDLADARGVIAWAEIPLVNEVSFDGTPPNPGLASNASQQLIELIRQNFNHPSIAVWSIANEIDNTPTKLQGPSRPAALLRSLNVLAKAEDPSRATTFADCCEIGIPPQVGKRIASAASRDTIVGMADTVGYNRYFGWYDGTVGDFGSMLDEAHARHPALPIAVSEYGAGAALTQHTDDPQGGPINPRGRPHPEEFQNWYHEASWAQLKTRTYLWGVFIWNMFDFCSDARREGDLTDINDKGMVGYDRTTRKDAFYFYRANWSALPTLHLVGRRYVDRAYDVLDVKAYSNAASATLWLNGIEQGATDCSDGICLWRSVHLAAGANTLRATAHISGTIVSDALQWQFAGSPAIVRIKAGDISGYTTRDGQRYGSDNYYVGGRGVGINPPNSEVAKLIAVAASEPGLYGSVRAGEFVYRIPLPNGRYRVLLKFVEPAAAATGERLFDVTANQVPVLDGMDIFAAAGGRLKGVDRSFDVGVNDGVLVMSFQPRRGDALVSALSITPLAPL